MPASGGNRALTHKNNKHETLTRRTPTTTRSGFCMTLNETWTAESQKDIDTRVSIERMLGLLIEMQN